MTPGGAKLPNIKMELMFIKIMAQELINPGAEGEEREKEVQGGKTGEGKRREGEAEGLACSVGGDEDLAGGKEGEERGKGDMRRGRVERGGEEGCKLGK